MITLQLPLDLIEKFLTDPDIYSEATQFELNFQTWFAIRERDTDGS